MKKSTPPPLHNDVPQQLQKIFDEIAKNCQRSSTKKDLHSDQDKENTLAVLLKYVLEYFNFTHQFMREHEQTDPKLAYLFSAICAAVNQSAFHDGRCQMTANYAMLELAKNRIFDASIVVNALGKAGAEHFFVMIPDDKLFNTLNSYKSLHCNVTKGRFTERSIFFDPWSNQICRWENFEPSNDCVATIVEEQQIVCKSLRHMFANEQAIIERIIWCLKKFRTLLQTLPADQFQQPEVPNLQNETDKEFLQEVRALRSFEQCYSKLLASIDAYQDAFTKLINGVNLTLITATSSFFGSPIHSSWRAYPPAYLAKTKYNGHEVYGFTMHGTDSKHAPGFFTHLTKLGYSAIMKKMGEDPSIVVDITTSKPM